MTIFIYDNSSKKEPVQVIGNVPFICDLERKVIGLNINGQFVERRYERFEFEQDRINVFKNYKSPVLPNNDEYPCFCNDGEF